MGLLLLYRWSYFIPSRNFDNISLTMYNQMDVILTIEDALALIHRDGVDTCPYCPWILPTTPGSSLLTLDPPHSLITCTSRYSVRTEL